MARPTPAPALDTSSSTIADVLANLEIFRDSLPNSGDKSAYKTMADGFLLLLEEVRDGMGDADPMYEAGFRLVLGYMKGRLGLIRQALELDRKNAAIQTKCANASSVISAAIKRGAAGPQAATATTPASDATATSKPAGKNAAR